MDFTIKKYTELLHYLRDAGYQFITFEEYCSGLTHKQFVILRHDVDLKAENSRVTAEIEHALGIRASYYFRVVKQSNKPDIIRAVVAMGHEIGYHYEDMTICEGNADRAIKHFGNQLDFFRQYYPVRTICMHGAPRSQYDGRDLWKQYDYHDFGIIGEPYFDVDFSKVFYLTDTGRRWDGYNVSLRDKVPVYQDEWTKQGWTFHATDDIVCAVRSNHFPTQVMLTTHPQRWTDNNVQWLKEYVAQSAKNVVKGLMVSKKNCIFAPK